jgi:hypothetical protein
MNQIKNDLPTTTWSGVGSHDVGVVGDIPAKSLDLLVKPHQLTSLFLGPERALAAEWWMWHLVMIGGVYVLLFVLTKNIVISAAIALLLALSPSTQWWVAPGTFTTVGYGSLAAASVIAAINNEKRRERYVFGCLAGWALACFICTLYVPWIITTLLVVGPVVLGVVIQKLVKAEDRTSALKRCGLVGVLVVFTSVLLVAIFGLRHIEAIRAVNGTVYPGQRAAEIGGTLNPATVFGAPFDFLAYGKQTVTVNNTNQSENASGVMYFVPILVAWFGLVAGGFRVFQSRVSASLTAAFAACLVFISWAVLPLPSYVGRLFLLDRVPPSRVLPGLALASVLVLGLFLALLRQEQIKLRASVVATSLSAFVFIQLWAAGLYRVDQVAIDLWRPVGIILFLTVALGAMLLRWTRIGLAILVFFGSVQFAQINPIQVGAQALLDNPVSSMVSETNKKLGSETGWLQVGGDVYVRGSLEASGVRFVSGISRYPNHDAWRILDPKGKYEDAWNRYAHVAFEVGEPGTDPVITTPQADVVYVRIDPCDPRLASLGVNVIVTQDFELPNCGEIVSEVTWGSRKIRAYQVFG